MGRRRPAPPPGHPIRLSYGWPGGGVGRRRFRIGLSAAVAHQLDPDRLARLGDRELDASHLDARNAFVLSHQRFGDEVRNALSSAKRRVGNEWVRTCKYRWEPKH